MSVGQSAQSAVDRSQQVSQAHGSATQRVAPAGQVSSGAGASSGDQSNDGASPELAEAHYRGPQDLRLGPKGAARRRAHNGDDD